MTVDDDGGQGGLLWHSNIIYIVYIVYIARRELGVGQALK